MIEQPFPCPLCHGPMRVTPARWHTCPHCYGRVLVPSTVAPPVLAHCTVCGDLVSLASNQADDDVVCPGCFTGNFAGAGHCEHPTVGRLVEMPVVCQRTLQALDRQRWPLTHGHASP